METNEILEIIREARKAGMQTALLMFALCVLLSGVFCFYIYQSYGCNLTEISQNQDGEYNYQEIDNATESDSESTD